MKQDLNNEKFENRQTIPQQKPENKDHRQSKISYWRLWMSFVGCVAVLATGLSIYFGMSLDKANRLEEHSDNYYQQQLTNVYRQSLYRLSDGLENTDVTLGKMLVTNDPQLLNKLLVQTSGLAEGAVGDISTLPMEQETVSAATKYFNQLSDFCKSIADDLSQNKVLTQTQKDSIADMKSIATVLKDSVADACLNNSGFKRQASIDAPNIADISFSLEDIDQNTFDYPQLVYDGPFSDSVTQKSFNVEKISTEEVAKKLADDLKDYNVSDIEFVTEVNNKVKVYSFKLKLDGKPYSVQTALNGMVAQLNAIGEEQQEENNEENTTQTQSSQKPDQDSCCSAALKMAQALGYEVSPMWVSQTIEDRVYVNMVANQDKVIMYPDMVKMAIDMESGKVVGIDAFGYIANHKKRSLPKDILSAEQAKQALGEDVKVNSWVSVVVPDGSEEKLCYEFRCTANGENYLIYVDALDKTEVEILKILDDKMGYTVM